MFGQTCNPTDVVFWISLGLFTGENAIVVFVAVERGTGFARIVTVTVECGKRKSVVQMSEQRGESCLLLRGACVFWCFTVSSAASDITNADAVPVMPCAMCPGM